METTTGLALARARTTSRQIVSEATWEPPGLFTRSTIASTRSSAVAARSAAASVSDPIAAAWTGPRPLRPRLMTPLARVRQPARAARKPLRTVVAADVLQFGVVARFLAHRRVYLVAVAECVHES